MGNLEKAGVGVVVALLLVIMIVAFTTEPETGAPGAGDDDRGRREEAGLRSDRETESREANAELENPSHTGRPSTDPGEQDDERPIGAPDPTPTENADPAGPEVGRDIDDPSTGSGTGDPVTSEPGSTTAGTGGETRDPTPNNPTPVDTAGWPKTVVAGDGDSLWTLARRVYGTNRLAALMAQPIMRANGLKSDRIRKGDKLKLPAPPATARRGGDSGERPASSGSRPAGTRPASVRRVSAPTLPWEPDPTPTPRTPRGGRTGDGHYIVKKNESLSQIAERELGSVKRMPELIELNGIKDKNRIFAGMRLKLPAK